jgi:hypothetical protein
MTTVLKSLLPKLNVNWNTARSIIFGPEELGGLSLPNLYIVQGIDKLKLFLGHLRLQDQTGNLLHINFMILQLLTGSRSFFMNKNYNKYKWVEKCWLTSLWAFTTEASLTFNYQYQWIPTTPRKYDKFIMDFFLTLHLPFVRL